MDKIICLGRNYLDHAKEMGGPVPEKPVLFLKPPSVLRLAAQNGDQLKLQLPENVGEVHHEVEIVLRIDRGGFRMSAAEAEKAIGAVSLGLDMTLRDLQAAAKKNGHPWTTSKVFVDAATVGPWLRVSEFPEYLEQKFSLSIDGAIKQEGFGKNMRMTPAEAVAYVSECFPLCPGDLIFTGTPAGVGPVVVGSKGVLTWGNINYSVVWEK